jgi:hypothetical protein
MRTRATRKSRSWRLALRSLLAVYLACFVGGDRLFGLAHLALSDHRHAFCEAHGRFEDLPRADASARETSPSPDTTDQHRTTVGGLADTLAAHSDCLFLNGRTFQAPIQLAGQEPTIAPEDRGFDQAGPRQAGFVAGQLLLSAPKTSPPGIVA